MLLVLGLFLFILLVIVHELGHFFAARRAGVEVEEFGVGYPPRLYGKRFEEGGTLYSVNLLPLGGFVRLKPDGLYMVEKVYAQGPKTIRLAGMIHLGEEDYYRQLLSSISPRGTLVLAEGVSDEQQRLRERFSYGQLADLLGLSAQEEFPFPGRLIKAASLRQPSDRAPEQIDVLRADVDLQQFDARTVEVLNALGKYLLNAPSLIEGIEAFNRWAEQHVTPEVNQVVMHDLLDRRNAVLLDYLEPALNKYDTLVIPWGALHMPGIEAGVEARDFRLQQILERQSVDFFRLPWSRIWQHRGTELEGTGDSAGLRGG